ncbi:CWC16 protein [Xylaria flabelliformis]|nr:CWC16 protein [Xylaria flabelliformis]
MSERKVLTKYYPPDFDPSAIQRVRKPKATGPKVQTVRLMAPFSMKCLQCGEYIYRGRKFNARKETPVDEKYLGIQIFRFYIKCTRCSAEICFKTDPKNNDYACERGAKRNTEPWRVGREETDEERLDRLEKEEEERDAMVELEAKTVDAKREMAVADALDEIRTRNARVERADRDGLEASVIPTIDEEAERQEREDAEAARRAFSARQLDDMIMEEIIDEGESTSSSSPSLPLESNGSTSKPNAAPTSSAAAKSISTDMPPPSFKRVVKKKKDHAALLGIKKKPSLV